MTSPEVSERVARAGEVTKLGRRVFITAAASLVACRRAPSAAPEKAPRIVSVSPSMTETVFALGAGRWLVGRTSFCDYPKEALAVPVVGGFTDPSLEAIVALAPTLVVGERRPGGRDLAADLAKRGVESFFPPMYSLDQIELMISALGAKLGASEAGTRAVGEIRRRIDAVNKRVGDRARPKTLLLFDFRPLVAAGPDAFPNELLTAAGAKNAVTSGGEYPRLSPEGVLALDPDLVLDGSAGAYPEAPEALLRSIPGLDALRALREGRVRRLLTKTALRPGPRIGEGIEELASLVHPLDEAAP